MFKSHRVMGVTLFLLFSTSAAFAGTRMIFPRIVFKSGLFSGIAISNPNTTAATITLTAYNTNGTKYAIGNNDVSATIPAGGQYLKLATQVFTAPTDLSTPTYLWVDVNSNTTGLTGFYIEGDDSITFQYGGDLGTFGTDLYLPAVENTGATVTEISLVNPDLSVTATPANLTVDFLKADGTQAAASASLTLAKGGAVMGALSGIPGFNVTYAQVVALRVHSDKPVLCYGLIRPAAGKTPVALPAEDVTTPAKTLYFPQLAQGSGWATGLGIANLDFSAQTLVNISAFKPDGTLYIDPSITNPVSVTIPAGGFLHKSFTELFPFTDSSYKEGWIKVEADSSAINGFVEYGSGSNRALVIAQLNSYQLSMFSHQAQAAPYFTGLAILNPGSLVANVEIFSLDDKGNPWGKTQIVLKPGQRISQLLYQLVVQSADKTTGSVYVRSDRPVISTELFARNDVTALANVPPQQVTTSFNPAGAAKVAPIPNLAVVETTKTQKFTVPGASSGVDWYVNGIKNGNSDLGTIDGTGSYKAPAKAPAPRTLTISATSGNSTGGSSIDVVQREQLTGGLTLVTAVAYMTDLRRFFVAEQQLVSGAPSVGYAAGANSNISEITTSGGTTTKTPFQAVPGDTIAKMLPYVSGTKSYLLLAGRDLGKIYRLEVATKTLATVQTGLNQPNSMAIDPSTGNVLVAESGANLITVVAQSKILNAAAPSGAQQEGSDPGLIAKFAVTGVQGIAVDNCTGTVYATTSDGELREYQGNSNRTIASGLDHPGQLLAIYRDGFSCKDSLTLAVVEATRVELYYPKSSLLPVTLLDTSAAPVVDLTFFPTGNPFTGGEASLGFAQPSATTGSGVIADVRLGGAYEGTPPISIPFFGSITAVGPNEDPIGDTFDLGLASEFGYSVPDITSVTGKIQGSNLVITIKFAGQVTLGTQPTTGLPPDGVWAFIFMKTTGAGSVPLFQGLDLSTYFPFGDASLFTFDSWIGVFYGQGEYLSLTELSGGVAEVSAVGNALTLAVPASAFTLTTGASAIVIVGNPGEFTDVAPNSGILELVGPVR